MADYLSAYQPVARHGARLRHWQQGEVLQFVTFRLNDALPQAKLASWRAEREAWLAAHPKPWDAATEADYADRFDRRIQGWLDAGYGSCRLRLPEARGELLRTLAFDQGRRADFVSTVIMPNHVHLLFRPRVEVGRLVQAWKGISARRIGLGGIWQSNYHDRMIRDASHLESVVRYIRRNPDGLGAEAFTLWESERARAIG